MSRRRNGTNRAAAMTAASRYTGYVPKKKKAVSLEELNGRLKNKTQGYYSREQEENQDGRKSNNQSE